MTTKVHQVKIYIFTPPVAVWSIWHQAKWPNALMLLTPVLTQCMLQLKWWLIEPEIVYV